MNKAVAENQSQKQAHSAPSQNGGSASAEIASSPVVQRIAVLQRLADQATMQRVRIGGVRYKTVAELPGSHYRLVRLPGTTQRLLADMNANTVLAGNLTSNDSDLLLRVIRGLNADGVANTNPVVTHVHGQITGGTAPAHVLAELRQDRGTAYAWDQNIAHTSYEIVREIAGPHYTIRHKDTGNMLGANLSMAQSGQFALAIANMHAQGVTSLDDVIADIKTSIPIDVTIARMTLIRNNVRDVIRVRIAADHNAIRGMPGGNTIDPVFANAFDSIEIPGSDPHKGGQVVAFINYHKLPAHGGGRHRVVYKPGDLSMDMLLFNDVNSVAATLGGGVSAYHIESMPADALSAGDPNLAHYGYMEFVPSGAPQTLAQIQSVYHSLGENLAVAYVFGLRDIHGENFVLKDDSIQLIDMEATTNTYDSFNAMELIFSAKPLPQGLANRIGKGLAHFTAVNAAARVPASATLLTAAQQGFEQTLRAMHRDKAQGPQITALVQQSTHTETRFVPIPTEKLQFLAALYHGRLVPYVDPVRGQYRVSALAVAQEVAANLNGGPQLQAELLRLLLHADTHAALNVGDVPFWTRRGRSIYSQSGVRVIRRSHNPRLNRSNTNETDANDRRKKRNRPAAAADFMTQVLPMMGDPRAAILAAQQT